MPIGMPHEPAFSSVAIVQTSRLHSHAHNGIVRRHSSIGIRSRPETLSFAPVGWNTGVFSASPAIARGRAKS